MTPPLPLLPTTVIGSYSMPEWLERAKNEYLSRRLSRRDLDEMHDAVRKAAIKDQEMAGVDLVSDGEAQRDNMIDYFTERMPSVQVDLGSKRFYYDFYDSVVKSKLASGSLGLADEARFLSKFSERPTKISISGPHTLVKRIRNAHYPSEESFALDLGRVLNFEMKELVRAGATHLQIDEPYYSGFPEDLAWAVKAVNAMVDGVHANITLHICYGNRYGKPSFEGSYRYLFPTILDAHVHTVSLEFARRGEEDLQLFKEFDVPFTLGLGVIDVKSQDVESSALVADRIRRALEVVPAERLVINPDCGCVRLPRDVAFNKLCSMVEGTRTVRKELGEVIELARQPNTLADGLKAGQFTFMAELVASATKREDEVLEVAARLVAVPQIAAIGVTSYAGGHTGHDPVRIAAGVRGIGLTPNIHLTCVSQNRQSLANTLRKLQSLGLHNVFTISGDWPQEAGSTPVFDVDSVQLAGAVAELRAHEGTPFHISVAVSPFKYQREDCLYQYLKLEKKIAAGANMAITQVGWDAKKFIELKRYLDERGLTTPLLGYVYVLSAKAAERMSTGNPPGCWASPELVAATAREAGAADKGLAARLERAATTVAILKGLGYAGAYLGGTHDPRQLAQIIGRGEELAPRWEELVDELQFGRRGGFYLYDPPSQPKPKRTFLPVVLDAAGSTLPVPWAKQVKDTAARRAIAGFFGWLDHRPLLSHLFERFEYFSKREVFGCKNCGNCVLGSMEYVCPQTCPKQMRNGPCGGTHHGQCEVIPEQPCIWVQVMTRAEAADQVDSLKTYIPPPDRTLTGTASWLNFYLERDNRPGRPKAGFDSAPTSSPEARDTTLPGR